MGPVTTLPLEKAARIDLRQAARYFGEPGEPDDATMALLERVAPPVLAASGEDVVALIQPVLAAAMPRAVWRRCDVAELKVAGFLQGQDVPAHLSGCDEALLLAVTLGTGVDRQIRLSGIGDIAAGVAADALASALAEQSADQAEALLRQRITGEGRYLTCRYSPGYGDWPVTVQPQAAELLDAGRQIGLYVTDTALMTPRKSVTALLGVSHRPVTGRLAGCGHCALRGRCEYRKRGKTCASQ